MTALVNSAGTLQASYRYDPYGRWLSGGGSLASANGLRFSSKPWVGFAGSVTSGLYYYGFRFYDPYLQRWVNRDPLGEAVTINLYNFVINSPAIYVDVDGRGYVPIVVGGVAVGVLIIVLPDWDVQALNQSEAAKLARLLNALNACAREVKDEEVCDNLNSMTITGRFKKPRDNDDSAETRNGRFFGYGNRTILPSTFAEMDDCGLANILLHESYHAGTEDWTENKSYDYAEQKINKMKACLLRHGIKCP